MNYTKHVTRGDEICIKEMPNKFLTLRGGSLFLLLVTLRPAVLKKVERKKMWADHGGKGRTGTIKGVGSKGKGRECWPMGAMKRESRLTRGS